MTKAAAPAERRMQNPGGRAIVGQGDQVPQYPDLSGRKVVITGVQPPLWLVDVSAAWLKLGDVCTLRKLALTIAGKSLEAIS